jgi:6-phosphogluconolactonase (cycloisomerase 2 family)
MVRIFQAIQSADIAVASSRVFGFRRKRGRLPALCGVTALMLCGVLSGPSARAATATSTTITATSGGNPATTVSAGSVVTLTATVQAGTTPVTPGLVEFCDATAAHCEDIHIIGTAQLTSAGTAVVKFRPGVGSHTYKAVFVGTNTYATSTSGAAALSVPGFHSTSTAIESTGVAGSYTVSAIVTGTGHYSPAPTGTVSFLDTSHGNAVLGTGTLGSGTLAQNWSNSSNPATGYDPIAMVVADFNGDGIPDFATLNYSSDSITVFLGNGDGTFTAVAPNIPIGEYPNAFTVADLNGDGVPDLAVVYNSEATGSPGRIVTILLGNGDGTFAATATSPSVGTDPRGIVAGDFNGDGIPDLATANYLNDTVTILLGNGDGAFTAAAASPATGVGPGSITVLDFNGDGKLDLAVANVDSDTLTVLLGNGDGTFTPTATSPATGTYPDSVVAVDLSGNGIPDLVVANESSNITVLIGVGNGTFTAAASPGFAENIVVGDFNGDGVPDLAGSYSADKTIVFLGHSNETFATGQIYTATGSSSTFDLLSIATGDFNGDGLSDLVTAGAVSTDIGSTGQAEVLLSNPQTTAEASASVTVGAGASLVEASYSGDSIYGVSVSATTALMGVPDVSTTLGLADSAGPYTSGESVTLTATLSPYSNTGNSTNGELVYFYNGTKLLGTGTLSGGVAIFNYALPTPTQYSISATYPGDSEFITSFSNSVSITAGPAPLVSISISPSPATINAGTAMWLDAIGTYADKSTKNLTYLVEWQSLDSSIASVSATGLTTGIAVGSTSITATTNGITGTGSLIVLPSIAASNTFGHFLYTAQIAINPPYTSTINVYAINGATGALASTSNAPVSLPAQISSWAIHPSGSFLFVTWSSATEVYVSVYAVDGVTGGLTQVPSSPFEINSTVADGASAAYLAQDPAGKFLYVSTQAHDTVQVFGINSATGALEPTPETPVRGTFLYMSPGGGYLYTEDSLAIAVDSVEPTNGALTQLETTTKCFSDLEVSIDRSGQFFYSAMGPTGLLACQIDPSSGVLTPLSGSPFMKTLLVGDQFFDPSGRFFYVVGAVPNSQVGSALYGYTVDAATGDPIEMQNSPFAHPAAEGTKGSTGVAGVEPRGFYVYAADPTYGIVAYSVDQTTGELTLLPNSAQIAEPSAVLIAGSQTRWDPGVAWSAPTPITYGTALSSTQLNATAEVAGTFSYTPAAGTVLGAGAQTLSVTFTPTDIADFIPVTTTVTITVNKATPTITWAAPAAITYGTPLGSAQLDASSTVGGNFSYTPAAGAVPGAGIQTLTTILSPTDSADYTEATGSVTLVVNQATPTITWATPTPIAYGTPLSAAQLDATSSVPGSYVYTPPAGTILGAGSQTLKTTLTPTDGKDYTTATATVMLTVNKAATTTKVVSSINPSALSQSVTFTATVTAAYGTPTGTVTFLSNGTSIGTGTLAGGVATFSTSTLPAGINSITATFGGSADYNASSAPALSEVTNVAAVLTSPTPGSVLGTTNVVFSWTPVAGATEYDLYLGTTGVGSANLYNSAGVTTTSVTVPSLPSKGVTVYARLYYQIKGAWQYTDYTYTETPVPPALTTPTPGSVLGTTNVVFSWTPGGEVTQYDLYLGTTAVGSDNLYNSAGVTTTSVSVATLPSKGATVYARLYYQIKGVWQSIDYTYTESQSVPPVLTSPAPGSVLGTTSVVFSWTPGAGVTEYDLNLGTTGVGSMNLYNSAGVTTTSVTVPKIPATGATVYARLYYQIKGAWQYIDYTYTEQ